MKLTAFVAFVAAAGVVAVSAQQVQDIRVVTSDTMIGGALPPGLAGGTLPMSTGNGVIFGQVTEGESNRPVPGAIVSITLPGAMPLRVMADGQGRFGFRNLPKGRFNVTATKPGWVDGAYGRTRPAGPVLPIALADDERVSGVVVPIWRYASVGGRVVDESGDPLVNVPVRVMKRSTVGGKTKLTPGQTDSTDDRGVYRIGSLEPGEYVVVVPMQTNASDMPMFFNEGPAVRDVMVTARAAVAGGGGAMTVINGMPMGSGVGAGVGEDGRPLTFPTVFYPNAMNSARATIITIGSGEERAAIDFQLRGVPTSKVSGIATGPEGLVPNLQLTLVPAEVDDAATQVETLNGFSDEQGRFTIEGVPPGQYVLRGVRMPRPAMGPVETSTFAQGGQVVSYRVSMASGSAPLPTDSTLWAEMSLAVGNKDIPDVALSLRPGVKVNGTIQFNGSAERPTSDRMGSVALMLEPADQKPGVTSGRGRVDASGTFTTVGVPPGKYFIRVNGAYQNWTFLSAQVNGRDASVVPVDLESNDVSGVVITFTDRPNELSGQVTGDGSLETSAVLIFPTESAAWVGYGNSSRRFANLRADKQGNFKTTGLPVGEYFAIAIPDKMANDWQNPKFLESLTSEATRFRIRDGEKQTISLKVAR